MRYTMLICTMKREFSTIFMLSVLVFGLILNPSVFPDSTVDSNPISNIIFKSAFAQTDDATTDDATTDDATTDDATTDEDVDEISQQVSNFVSESRNLFQDQKAETKAAIKACRESIRNADSSEVSEIKQQCKDNLKSIKESYKELRQTYKETYKEFRDTVRLAVKEHKGMNVSDDDKKAAKAKIKSMTAEKREKIKDVRKAISEELKEERKQVREEKKEERKQVREEKKEERDAMKEEKKEENS